MSNLGLLNFEFVWIKDKNTSEKFVKFKFFRFVRAKSFFWGGVVENFRLYCTKWVISQEDKSEIY